MQLQKSLEQCKKNKSVVVQQGAGKFFGYAKDFCPNSPKLAREKLRPPKKALHFLLGAIFAHLFRGLLIFSGIL